MEAKITNTKFTYLRNLALIGAFGGALMLLADYLFFLTPWVNGAEFDSQNAMYTMSTQRLIWGGIFGPIAGLFYSIGSWVFYVALKAHNKPLAFLVSGLFILVYTLAGAAHCLYTVNGFAGPLDPAHMQPIIKNMIDVMGYIIAPSALAGSVLFVFMVLRYKTVFPKWVVLFTPIIWTLLKPVFVPFVPSPLGSILIGGWTNWNALVFFLILAFIWHKKNADGIETKP